MAKKAKLKSKIKVVKKKAKPVKLVSSIFQIARIVIDRSEERRVGKEC